MAIMQRKQGNLTYADAGDVNADKILRYLLKNSADGIVAFPGTSADHEREDDLFPMRRYTALEWNEAKAAEVANVFASWNKEKLLDRKNQGWRTSITPRGKGHEYDYIILSWANSESKLLLQNAETKQQIMEAATRAVTKSLEGRDGVKHAFLQAHEDSANFHLHILMHRHAVDVARREIGVSEMLTKGHTPTTDLMANINLEIERILEDKELFEALKMRDCLDEEGNSLFGDRIRAQSLAAQQEASEAIMQQGGIQTKVPGKVDYSATVQDKVGVKGDLANEIDSETRETEDITAQIHALTALRDSKAKKVTILQQALGILEIEEERKKEIVQLQINLEETKTELEAANENLLAATSRAEQLVSEQQELQEKMNAEIAKRDEFIDALEADIDDLKGDKEELGNKVAELEKAQSLLNTELETAREEANMAMEDVANLTDKLTTQTAAMKAMTDERDKALAEVDDLRAENEDISWRLDEARAQMSTLANTVSEQAKQIGEVTKQRDDAQANVTRLNDSIREIQAANERILGQLKATHEQAMAAQKADMEAAQAQTIEALKAELEIQKEQALAAQKAELQSAQAAALESLKAEMAKAHESAMTQLREEMLAAHKAEMTALRQELTASHGAEVQAMQQEMEKMREDLKATGARHQEEMQAAATKAAEAQAELTQTIAQLQEDLKSTRGALISTREENERLTTELAEANRARGKMEGQMEVMQAQMDEQRKQMAEMMTMMRGLGATRERASGISREALVRQIIAKHASDAERAENADMIGYNRDGDIILGRVGEGRRLVALAIIDKEGQAKITDGDREALKEMVSAAKARLKDESEKIHEIDDEPEVDGESGRERE